MRAPAAARPSAAPEVAAAPAVTAAPAVFMSDLGGRIRPVLGLGLAALTLSGCAVSQSHFEESRSAAGVGLVQVSSESGDFSYQGAQTEVFSIAGESWGVAFKEDAAHEHEDGNALAIDASGGALRLDATSRSGSAGIHLDLTGPVLMSSDISLDDGDAELYDVIGYALVTADSVEARRLEGGADLFARDGGVVAELYPAPGESVRIEAVNGSVDLTLPFGGAYDLQVWGDPEHTLEIDDFGFHSQAMDAAYFAGRAGRGDIQVTVIATGGDVRVRSGW